MTKGLTLLLYIGLVSGESDLSIKEEAVLDAKGDAKNWLAYPPLALINVGVFATATFLIGEEIFEINDDDIFSFEMIEKAIFNNEFQNLSGKFEYFKLKDAPSNLEVMLLDDEGNVQLTQGE